MEITPALSEAFSDIHDRADEIEDAIEEGCILMALDLCTTLEDEVKTLRNRISNIFRLPPLELEGKLDGFDTDDEWDTGGERGL